ncbi:hypothetical protein J5226_21210 [Lysobacter sp. K5869]|uniref:hypothetical protein n=1 Tax=Lysobacter sp. K5869 TaxID=2820808 RepID=UPI001C062FCC|nr:hypothetical protein [Lysobacter sp. K5869]QWP76086.1 hypothetical protein J5226_21210 [Lysobacter sp. K5869]
MNDVTRESYVIEDAPKLADLMRRVDMPKSGGGFKPPASLRAANVLLGALIVLHFLMVLCGLAVVVVGGALIEPARHVGLALFGLVVVVIVALGLIGLVAFVRVSADFVARGLGPGYAARVDRAWAVESALIAYLADRYPLATLERLRRRIKTELDAVTQRMTLAVVVAGVAAALEKLGPGTVAFSDTWSFVTAGYAAAAGAGLGALLLASVRETLQRLEYVVGEAVERAKAPPPVVNAGANSAASVEGSQQPTNVVPLRAHDAGQSAK